MNRIPANDDDEELDQRFRSGLADEEGRPNEAVRRAILENGARAAAAQRERSRPAANDARWRPAIFGTLAAAVFAGLLVVPILRAPVVQPPSAASSQASKSAPAPTSIADGAAGKEQSDDAANAPRATAVKPQIAVPKATTSNGSMRAQPAAPAADDTVKPAIAASKSTTSNFTVLPQVASSVAADASASAAAPAAARHAAALDAIAGADQSASLRDAAAIGDTSMVQSLVAASPRIDSRDANGRTALMLAVMNGHADVVAALLAHGADANAADDRGTTPLQIARALGRPEIIDSLLRAGAR
jgi:hypothetical protein